MILEEKGLFSSVLSSCPGAKKLIFGFLNPADLSRVVLCNKMANNSLKSALGTVKIHNRAGKAMVILRGSIDSIFMPKCGRWRLSEVKS